VGNKKYIFVAILVFLSFASSNVLKANTNSVAESYEVLFIGSSYFSYNNLPNLFLNLVNYSKKEVFLGNQVTFGYLSDHASSASTEAKINERDWDFVILQGVGSITAYPNYYTGHPVYPALEALQDKILDNCESTEIVFCLPWAYEDGMTWLEGWTDTYEDMQIKIYDNTLLWCNSLNIMVAPVGWAWYEVLDKKSYPLHYLHLSDWNHPSLKGSYLMACAIFSTVYQESSAGLTYYGGLSQADAEYYQTVASNIVLNNLELWNISDTNTCIEKFSEPTRFNIYQNFPNPFNQSTQIKYEVFENSFVEIAVFDLSGKLITTLVRENKPHGSYSVRFNRISVNSGLYFYQLKSGNQQITKKMMLIK